MESNYADPEELAFAFGILNHIYHIEQYQVCSYQNHVWLNCGLRITQRFIRLKIDELLYLITYLNGVDDRVLPSEQVSELLNAYSQSMELL